MKNIWAPWRGKYIDQVADKSPDSCFLCDAASSDDPAAAYVVHQTELSFVILNIYPYNTGHLMVVPKKHTGEFEELTAEELLDLGVLIQKSIKALKKAYQPHGFNVGMNIGRVAGAGLETHLHFHIVPRWKGDTNFMPVIADTKIISQTLDESFERIRQAFEHGT